MGNAKAVYERQMLHRGIVGSVESRLFRDGAMQQSDLFGAFYQAGVSRAEVRLFHDQNMFL